MRGAALHGRVGARTTTALTPQCWRMDNSPFPDPPNMRSAALDMLADGNSVESVAHLCGLSVDVVSAWARGESGLPQDGAGRPVPEPVPTISTPGHTVTRQEPAPDSKPAPRPAPGSGPGFAVQVVVLFALMTFWIGDGVWMAWKDLRYASAGSPPIEKLQRTEGWVVDWGFCNRGTRHTRPYQFVVLEDDHGTRRTSGRLPCLLYAGTPDYSSPHHMIILSRPTEEAGDTVYDIELDGRTLLAYAKVKQQVDSVAAKWVVFACILTLMLMLVSIMLLTICRNARRWSAARG